MKEVRKKNGVVNIITEDSFEDKTSNFYETPKAFLTTPQEDPHLDSSRRYASEHEQELKVKPEKMENIENLEYTESDSSYSELNIELKQCDMASNNSSNMTPRIEQVKNLSTPTKIHKEIDFTETMKNSKLSPENIALVHQLTSNRKKEIEQENESLCSFDLK